MRIVVGPLDTVDMLIVAHRPDRVVSLLAPDQGGPEVGDRPYLRLDLHDISLPQDGLIPPGAEAVKQLLEFAAGPPQPDVLLIHCWFAISRSPAAAYVVACALCGEGSETGLAEALRAASPECTPNPRLVALADAQLGRDGRMIEAIAAIGRGREAGCGGSFTLHVRPA